MLAAATIRGVSVATTEGNRSLVEDVSFDIAPGEILGMVGESGSGKTTLGLALLRHCRRGLQLGQGSVRIGGIDLASLPPAQLKRLWGHLVCYVPQDPGTALNPALRIRKQLAECLGAPSQVSDEALFRLLEEVRLPASADFLDAFPHQMSGGQLQRVAIAMAFANRPRLVVMDEPTTGLDVTTQAHVLATVRRLCEEHQVAVVYVTHDIAVVAAIADRVAVVYGGRIVEIGPSATVLHRAAHPYTRALIRAVPDLETQSGVRGIPGRPPEAGVARDHCAFAPRCTLALDECRHTLPPEEDAGPGHTVRCLRAGWRQDAAPTALAAARGPAATAKPILSVAKLHAFYGQAEVLHDLSLEVPAGACLGLVGESGSGKTTLARCIGGLHEDAAGAMVFANEDLLPGSARRDTEQRRRIQYVFQNPYASLNPRRSIGGSIAIALSLFERCSAKETRARVATALEAVALSASTAAKYPHQLSGGQRQRAAIARALIVNPDLLICDEITSALDVSVQAVIMELLMTLRRERGLAILFVTHNLAVVRILAQSLIILQSGRIVESGETESVLRNPQAEETKRLLRDAPRFAAQPGTPEILVPLTLS
jgi:peptide/nickel transport system ATP-binding protein